MDTVAVVLNSGVAAMLAALGFLTRYWIGRVDERIDRVEMRIEALRDQLASGFGATHKRISDLDTRLAVTEEKVKRLEG